MSYNALARVAPSGRPRLSSATVVVVVLLVALGRAESNSSTESSSPLRSGFDLFQVFGRQASGCTPMPSEYEGKTISTLPCGDILVDLPFNLKFSGSQKGVKDQNNMSTGMRMYMPATNLAVPFKKSMIAVQKSQQRLRVTGSNGNWELKNGKRVQNAMGVGLPVPNSAIKLEMTVKMPDTSSTARERFCLFVAISDREFAWTCILRQSGGYRVYLYSQTDGVQTAKKNVNGVKLGADRKVTLRMDILPADSEIRSSYERAGKGRKPVATINVDSYTLNADQAATDALLESRTMGGFVGLRDPNTGKAENFFVSHFSAEVLLPAQDTGTGAAEVDFTVWRVPDVRSPTHSTWADDKLWVATASGSVHKIVFNGQRTAVLSRQRLRPIGASLLTGITADPNYKKNQCLWLSHSSASRSEGVANSGKVTRACGPQLDQVTTVIWGLPRAVANHAPNNLWFRNGWLYLSIGSNTGSGAVNLHGKSYLTRPEQPLSAAIMRFNVFKKNFNGRCTPTQNPTKMDATGIASKRAPGCDVDVIATGTRNVFDCTFHSNGKLYCPDNGIASFGTTPIRPPGYKEGDSCDAVVGGADMARYDPGPRHDGLYHVKRGKYYGHPNPSRKECVMGGGNPTSSRDSKSPLMPVSDGQKQAWEVLHYPVGTKPQSNYDKPIASFGQHRSPDGIIEYKSSKMCGKLKKQLLVTWFSVEPQIRRLELNGAGTVKNDGTLRRSDLATGGTSLSRPLGITEDNKGNLFVSEFGGNTVVVFNARDAACTRRTAATNAPLELDGAASAADGTHLYAFGGRRGARVTVEAHVYDVTTDTWTSLPDLPEALADASAVVAADGKVLIVGGERADGTVSARVWAFDPTTGEYTERAAMPEARTGAVVALQQGMAVVVGGLGQEGGLPVAGTLRLGDAGTWERVAESSEPRAYAAGAVGADGQLLVCGGQVARGITRAPTQSCERFDGAHWSSVAPMREARSHHALFAHGKRFVAKGGYVEDGSISDSIEVLDLEVSLLAGKWAYVGKMRTGRSGAVHGALSGEMFTFSGRTESDLTRRGDAVHIN